MLRPALLSLALLLSACASSPEPELAGAQPGSAHSQDDLVIAVSEHLGVTSESAASVVERLFAKHGRPSAYITGEEGGGAFTFGARYGQGTLWMRDGRSERVFWQGPTVGFDAGAEASKVFTLVYGLDQPGDLLRRYPGMDGSAFLVAGMAVNVQKRGDVTLAPIRTGVGARLGANVGYVRYTEKRSLIPL